MIPQEIKTKLAQLAVFPEKHSLSELITEIENLLCVAKVAAGDFGVGMDRDGFYVMPHNTKDKKIRGWVTPLTPDDSSEEDSPDPQGKPL